MTYTSLYQNYLDKVYNMWPNIWKNDQHNQNSQIYIRISSLVHFLNSDTELYGLIILLYIRRMGAQMFQLDRVDNLICMLNLAYLGCTASACLKLVLIIYCQYIKEV